MARIDLHVHIGKIPVGRSKNVIDNPIEGVIDYIERSELTHIVCLYTDYNDVVELQRRKPELTIYGLQWIDLSNIKNTKLDVGKPLFKGIKIHSERLSGKDGYSLQQLAPILDKLPDDSIVLPHFQGTDKSHPMSFTRIAIKYNRLKFIIGHSGNYGLMSFKPEITYDFFENSNKREFMSLYLNAIQSVFQAVILANNLPNVFLESSTYCKHKQDLFNLTDNIGFGSDYPFKPALIQKLQQQENLYLCHTNDKNLTSEKIHQRSIDFIESNYKDRFEKYYEENRKKTNWIAFFSQTGSELYEVIKNINKKPDLIVTNRENLDGCNEDFVRECEDIIAFIPNRPSLYDYKDLIECNKDLFKNCFITLHGYLRIIPKMLCDRYKIYNGHPGLITKYPILKGFNPQEKAYNLKLKTSGSVIHKVTNVIDDGEVLLEKEVNIENLTLNEVYDVLHKNSTQLWVDFLLKIYYNK